MTDDEIKRLKELSEKATPGPWEAVWLGRDDHASEVHFAYEMRVCLMPSNGGERSGNDAEFIASARTAVPALLTALDEARAEAARLREALRHSLEWIDGWDYVFKDDPEWKEARYYIDKALEVKP